MVGWFPALGHRPGDVGQLGVAFLAGPGEQCERLVGGQLVPFHQDALACPLEGQHADHAELRRLPAERRPSRLDRHVRQAYRPLFMDGIETGPLSGVVLHLLDLPGPRGAVAAWV